MKRTYFDITGDYYDNLDGMVDWGEVIDIRVYDPNSWVTKGTIQIG